MRSAKLVAALCGLAFCTLLRAEGSNLDAAKQLFERYVALEQSYDPGVADLYAPEALIKSRRAYPMGEPRVNTIPAASYKAMLRDVAAAAKARGERNSYSNVIYAPEGTLVRIEASRSTEPGRRVSPISLLVGRSPNGSWLIYEEVSESQQ